MKGLRLILLGKKYNRDYPLQEAMRQEHVSLQIEQISQLFDLIKTYLQELKLEIIHEEKYENYWSIKAHKGGKGSVIIGNIREVEVMISGAGSNYDLILRTGAWGRDIVVPAAIASVVSLGVGVAVAGVEAYRAHSFEKNFWENINKMISNLGQGKATMSSPVTVTP
ncbi:MAG: hypothetical protein FIO02_10675 [Nitrosopumilales archaeon]|nr:hypothetical protein [Nitrosopumilales archaeon]